MKDRFIEQDTMVRKDGTTLSVSEWGQAVYGGEVKVFRNSTYQVVVRDVPKKEKEVLDWVWLSIKRIDKAPIHDWRDLQEIKNELVGRYCEGIELYPAESRCVDTANQYHLWVVRNPKFRFPIGFTDRVVVADQGESPDGARQRTKKQSLFDLWIGKIKMRKLNKVVFPKKEVSRQ